MITFLEYFWPLIVFATVYYAARATGHRDTALPLACTAVAAAALLILVTT